jgi:hypothetical protein
MTTVGHRQVLVGPGSRLDGRPHSQRAMIRPHSIRWISVQLSGEGKQVQLLDTPLQRPFAAGEVSLMRPTTAANGKETGHDLAPSDRTTHRSPFPRARADGNFAERNLPSSGDRSDPAHQMRTNDARLHGQRARLPCSFAKIATKQEEDWMILAVFF